MKGTELIRQLRLSGTGERKLADGIAYLERNPTATAEECYEAIRRGGAERQDVGYLGTLAKAAEIITKGRYEPVEIRPVLPEDRIEAKAAGQPVYEPKPIEPKFHWPKINEAKELTEAEEMKKAIADQGHTIASQRAELDQLRALVESLRKPEPEKGHDSPVQSPNVGDPAAGPVSGDPDKQPEAAAAASAESPATAAKPTGAAAAGTATNATAKGGKK